LTRLNRALRPWRLKTSEIPIWLLGLAFAMMWVMPFVWMVSTSFKYSSDVMSVDIEWLPRRITLENYVKMFSAYPVVRWGLNSLIVVTLSTDMCVFSGALAGFALALLKFHVRNALFLFLVL